MALLERAARDIAPDLNSSERRRNVTFCAGYYAWWSLDRQIVADSSRLRQALSLALDEHYSSAVRFSTVAADGVRRWRLSVAACGHVSPIDGRASRQP
jgi:hypothetical protein